MLLAVNIRNDGINVMDLAELYEIKGCEKPLEPWSANHKILSADTWKHHAATISMRYGCSMLSSGDRIIIVDIVDNAGYRSFEVVNDNASVHTHLRPWICSR